MAFRRRMEKKAPPREPKPHKFRQVADARFQDELVGRLINKVMLGGKKSTAERIVYDAFDMVESRANQPSVEVFRTALENIKPMVEVKSRRVGGSTYQVPIEVGPRRRISLGLRWLVGHARARGERTMADRLANEILDAQQSRGGAAKKREDTHRMAEANKAFAHFRW